MQLRNYQREAINSWVDNNRRSILAMATGTGKTLTAVTAIGELHRTLRNSGRSLTVIIICPFLNLVDQWAEYFEELGQLPIRAYESPQKWSKDLELSNMKVASLPGARQTIITTQATFISPAFQQTLLALSGELLIVGDEVHNLGSELTISKLPTRATYRLGLSATPTRWGDPVGTNRLLDYFGEISYTVTIKEAIELGALCEYRYYPRVAQMSFEETESYIEATIALARLLNGRSFQELSGDDATRAGALLRRRSAIVGYVTAKMESFEKDAKANVKTAGQLVYCAEGDSPLGNAPKQIQYVSELLARISGNVPAIYDANTPRGDREVYLRSFSEGSLQYLLSMRCLDEGVDVPNATTAYFLASSSNPRQFIQRRGRVLRQNGMDKTAVIYDYFAVPNVTASSSAIDIERNLGKKELDRVMDFIDSCSNAAEALEAIKPLRRFYE